MRTTLAAIPPATLAAAVLLSQGCSSDSTYVTDDSRKVVNINSLNTQDYAQAAADLCNQLLQSGRLAQAQQSVGTNGAPAIVKLSTPINESDQRVDMALLLQKMKMTLNTTGQAMFVTDDKSAAQITEDAKFARGDRTQTIPQLVLTSKLIAVKTTAPGFLDKTKQASYVFQMNLVDTRNGLELWNGEKDITKQGTGAKVGF